MRVSKFLVSELRLQLVHGDLTSHKVVLISSFEAKTNLFGTLSFQFWMVVLWEASEDEEEISVAIVVCFCLELQFFVPLSP